MSASEPEPVSVVSRSAVPVGPRTTIFRRLFATYAALVTIAVAVLIFAPVTISVPVALTELAGLLIGLAVMLLVFHALLRRVLTPLERLTGLMERIDPLSPGHRVAVDSREAEVAALADAFNGMLDRLEDERRESARRALAAQESERQRIARELHDEIGQVLTAIVLRADSLARRSPEALQPDLEALRETARAGADEVRQLARRLRPEALDELGLQSALLALCASTTDHSGLPIRHTIERDAGLSKEQELVIYRVAQEALTNVIRHARAGHADVTLERTESGSVHLQVCDDGIGLPDPPTHPATGLPEARSELGTGLRGMRERALLVGAELTASRGPAGGTQILLALPPEELP